MRRSIFLAVALCSASAFAVDESCAPPGFDSAWRIDNPKLVAKYVDIVQYQPFAPSSLRSVAYLKDRLAESEAESILQQLRYASVTTWVDVFIEADGKVQCVCYARGDARLMKLIVPALRARHFEALNPGLRVIVPLRYDLTWHTRLFGPRASTMTSDFFVSAR